MTPLLQLNGVSRRFVKKPDVIEQVASWLGADVRTQTVRAVDGVSFSVVRGEVVGLVGESGCGKSTLGRMIAGLIPPSEGEIQYDGQVLSDGRSLKNRRQRLKVQMIFQDPMSSLNPRMKVEDIVGESAVYHGLIERHNKRDYVAKLLEKVFCNQSACIYQIYSALFYLLKLM